MTTRLSLRSFAWYVLFGVLAVGFFTGQVPQADAYDWNLSAQLISDQDRPTEVVSSDFRTAVVGFINYFLMFLGLIAVAFVIYAGILMVTSQGEDENTGKAKKILLYAAIGIVIILLSFAIVRLIVGAGESVA